MSNEEKVIQEIPGELKVEQPRQTEDEFVVDWDGEFDPKNPLNWSKRAKTTNVALLSLLCFIT